MRPSFTGTGACLEDAYIESFFATLKKVLVYQSTFATHKRRDSRCLNSSRATTTAGGFIAASIIGVPQSSKHKICKRWRHKLNFQCPFDPYQLQLAVY